MEGRLEREGKGYPQSQIEYTKKASTSGDSRPPPVVYVLK